MVSKATIVTMAATALAAAAPARAQTADGVGGFQLPPAAPDIQGPVTPDNPIVERRVPPPRPVTPPKVEMPAPKPASNEATAAEKPTAPKPATPTATDSAKPKPGTQQATQPATPAPQAREPAASAERTAEPATAEIAPSPAPAPVPVEAPAATARPAPVIAPSPPVPEAVEASDSGWWRYLIVFLLLIPMGIAGLLFWRQHRGRREAVSVLPIERPKPRPAAAAVPEEPATVPDAVEDVEEPVFAGPLRHALETTSLSVSLINATLSYQLTLTNTSGQMLRNVAIFGDLVSAHASLSVEEQLAGPGGAHAPLHLIQALLPSQSTFLNGQLRLPISAIRPLRREGAVLFVPLARMRIEAEGLEGALTQTCVVGQKPAGPGAGLRPFRLDTGPRIYAEIGQRTLDLPTPQAA